MSAFHATPRGQRMHAEVVIRRFGPGDAVRLSRSSEARGGMESREAVPAGAAPGPSSLREPVGPGLQPGDFILTHSKGLSASLIRFGQRLRYWRAAERPYAHWNHAALVVSETGDLIEAIGRGVVRTPLSHYNTTEFYLVQLRAEDADERDRAQVIRFAQAWEGRKYGVMTIVSIAVSLLAGWKFAFSVEGQFICSGLVACGLERTSIIFDRGATHLMPADLARHFGVRPMGGASHKDGAPRPNWPPRPDDRSRERA